MAISMIATLLKRLGAICLVFVIYWHLTHHDQPLRGRAIVHVREPDVSVFVDEHEYAVPSLAESPVVCELSPGVHQAQIRRHGVLLAEETFVINPDHDVIVYPVMRSPAPAVPDEDQGEPKPKRTRAGGLAAVLMPTVPMAP